MKKAIINSYISMRDQALGQGAERCQNLTPTCQMVYWCLSHCDHISHPDFEVNKFLFPGCYVTSAYRVWLYKNPIGFGLHHPVFGTLFFSSHMGVGILDSPFLETLWNFSTFPLLRPGLKFQRGTKLKTFKVKEHFCICDTVFKELSKTGAQNTNLVLWFL